MAEVKKNITPLYEQPNWHQDLRYWGLKVGNVLNENQDMNIPEEYRGKMLQSRLRLGEASFNNGNCTIIFDECPTIFNPFPGLVVHSSKASLARRRIIIIIIDFIFSSDRISIANKVH